MKFILLISIIFLIANCSKHKTVLICGDHVCINKAEAKQFFNENLTLEVQIVNKKIDEQVDLVELNLRENENGNKEVQVFAKKQTNKKLKILSDKDKEKIRKIIKNKKKENKTKEVKRIKKNKPNKNKIIKENVNKERLDVVDVCTTLEKCNIEEISKYLLDKGKRKKFPDITTRQ